MADGATPNPSASPQAGGLLGQAVQAMQQRKALLDDPTQAQPAAPAPAPAAPNPKLIRPGYEQLDPAQWTDAERAAFRKAHNIEKPSVFQQLLNSLKSK